MRTILTLALLLPALTQAQIWYDPTFGTGGLVDIPLGPDYDGATAVALQTDGRIVVAGSINVGAQAWDFLVARYNADGTLDPGFGTGGFTTYNVTQQDRARGVAIQADGKIVVVGTSTSGQADKVIMRFTPDGILDPTFSGGAIIIDDSFASDQLNAVAVQPDQKIVAVGQGFNGSKNTFYIARFNTDGTFDASFSGGQIEHTISGDNCRAIAVAIMDDGRIVSVGTSFTDATTGYDAAAARYMADGTLDTTFDGDGVVSVPWSNDFDDGFAVCVQPDDKVLVGGAQGQATPNTTVAVTRLLDTGTPDGTFGVNGTVRPYSGIPPTACHALALDAAGNILVGGTIAANANESQSYLCRLLPADGAFDPAFGASGELVQGAVFVQEESNGLALQPDGRIVLAGSVGTGTDINVRLIRYLNAPASGVEETHGTLFHLLEVDATGVRMMPPGGGAMNYDLLDASGRSVQQGSLITTEDVPTRIAFDQWMSAGEYVVVLITDRGTAVAPFALVR
ncbi:MAG: delta-60 repeat domain-containing protein [Flavobacteriales bacterium]